MLKYVKRLTPLTGEGYRDEGERREQGTKSQIGEEGRREWNAGGAQVPLDR